MTDESPRNTQLPRVIVSLKSISPCGKGPQSGLSPGGGADVHDGGVSAPQYSGEIHDPPTKAFGEPRGILVTPVVHPARLGPFIGRAGKLDGPAGAIAKFTCSTCRSSVRILAAGQRSVDVNHDLGCRMHPLDHADELKCLFRFSFGVLRR